MFERFSESARTVVIEAQEQARLLGDSEITADHLLLGVLASGDNPAVRVLNRLGIDGGAVARRAQGLGSVDAQALEAIGVDLDAVRERAEASFGPGALDQPRQARGLFKGRGGGHIPFTSPAKDALTQSLRETLALGAKTIGPEHLLLGLLAGNNGTAAHTLRGLGADPAQVRAELLLDLGRAA
jgi:ATP-dependent Clp protease ATP-binding subunit ClpA